MARTAGDYLCERLADSGVSTVYGFPGDGINGILGALRRQTHTVHSGAGFWSARELPAERDLRAAADLLHEGKKVAMLVGTGALYATDEVIAVAEMPGVGVAKALLGAAQPAGTRRHR